MTGDHPCRARGCTEIVPAHILMCRHHWNQVPHHDQKAIYAAWDRVRNQGNAAARDHYQSVTQRVVGELALREQAAANPHARRDPYEDESEDGRRGMRGFFQWKRP